jgi:sugar (pentulose or hexulose) kinase
MSFPLLISNPMLLKQAIARLEEEGFRVLKELGSSHNLVRVATAGGGADNPTWLAMRARRLGVHVTRSANTEAAYGVALLGLRTPDPS